MVSDVRHIQQVVCAPVGVQLSCDLILKVLEINDSFAFMNNLEKFQLLMSNKIVKHTAKF